MAAKTLYTTEDLAVLPDRDGLPHEVVRGVLHLVSPAAAAHGSIISRLHLALAQHVYAHDLGELFSESTAFVLERSPDTVLCPDIAFVRAERLPPGWYDRGFAELAPDLAVEVLSPGDESPLRHAMSREMREKVADYLRLGVLRVWVVSPAARAVTEHDREGRERRFSLGDDLDGGDLLPGFRCPVAFLFAGLRPPRHAAGD
jgi:Uma2 family endonuclease